MGCLPLTPVAAQLQSDTASSAGWVDLASVSTSALSRYYPLTATPVAFTGVAQTTRQHLILRQLRIEETAASSGDIKKAPLIVYIYGSVNPGPATLGAVYNAATVRLLAQVSVPASAYERTSDTVWTATVNPNRYLRTEETSDATAMWAVIVSDQATTLTYAASASMRVNIVTESGTSL